MEKMKPCPVPWCGGTGDIREYSGPRNKPGPRIMRFKVRRDICMCSSAEKATKAEAVTAWNERPQSDIERLARELIRILNENAEGLDETMTALVAAVKGADRER